MLGKIMDFIAKHKVVAVIVGASMIMAIYLAGTAALDATSATKPDSSPSEEQTGSAPAAQGSRTQVDIVSAASEDAKALSSLVTSLPWRSADGAGKLEFDGYDYILTLPDGDDSRVTHGYLALAGVNSASGLDSDDGTYDTTIASLVDKKGMPHPAIISKSTQEDPNNPVWRMQCDLFGDAIWTTEYGYTSLEIVEMDKRVPSLMKSSKKKIEKSLREWASSHCSFATTATCTSIVNIDYAQKQASTTFKLSTPGTEDSAPVGAATVTVDLETGRITTAAAV